MPLFDRTRLKIKPLSARKHDLDISVVEELNSARPGFINKELGIVAQRLFSARERQRSSILMLGAHVIRSGVQNYLIDLMKRGYISCIATNGAGMIHDFELAMIGATTESVARYIKEGQFGLWQETGQLNDIINQAYQRNKQSGIGQAVGRYIDSSHYPYKNVSILAVASRLNIPVTVHVGIGYDIIHQHPNCDGAATGALSYNDFLKFASIVQGLEGGAVLNFGSAIMAPEVFLKALSIARNLAHQKGKNIKNFTTLVCDLVGLPANYRKEAAKDNPSYYFRPWKTMLVRTVAEGGESFYVQGRHSETIPALWQCLNRLEKNM